MLLWQCLNEYILSPLVYEDKHLSQASLLSCTLIGYHVTMLLANIYYYVVYCNIKYKRQHYIDFIYKGNLVNKTFTLPRGPQTNETVLTTDTINALGLKIGR